MSIIGSLQPRSEADDSLKWDLTDLFENDEAYLSAIDELLQAAEAFKEKYDQRLDHPTIIIEALKEYEKNKALSDRLALYGTLITDTDLTNSKNGELKRKGDVALAQAGAKVTFFKAQVLLQPESVLNQVAEEAMEYEPYIRHLLSQKDYQLPIEAEKQMAELKPIFDSPRTIFQHVRSNDLSFESFKIDGRDYPMSFVLYEEYYAYHPDERVRRESYEEFNRALEDHQHGLASNYYQQVLREKIEATSRGYDSVFDYLLSSLEVTRDMYETQIDVIMEEFAPVMRKYITHIKEVNGLEKMHYADLRMEIDPGVFTPISIEEGRHMIGRAIEPLGQEYSDLVMQAFDHKWIDFPRNQGKRTGASCNTAYGSHPFIIISWADRMDSVYTLIHELGHAGQEILSQRYQPISAVKPSLYISESPSTFNELLLSNYLLTRDASPRWKRAVYSKMISKTFFHNFVTHLLEAAYQREVYRLVDEGKGFGAETLNRLTRQVHKDFWQDAVDLEPGVEYTWMRQRHYFRGLYPVTYASGLTLSTQFFLKYKENGPEVLSDWLLFLSSGGRYTPAEAARRLGIDLETDGALRNTINYLDAIVDKIIAYSEELENEKGD